MRPVENSSHEASVRKTIVFSRDSDEAFGSPQMLPGPALGGQFFDDFWSRIRWWKGVAKQIARSLAGRVRATCGGYELFLDDFWSGRRVEAASGTGGRLFWVWGCGLSRKRSHAGEKNHCFF